MPADMDDKDLELDPSSNTEILDEPSDQPKGEADASAKSSDATGETDEVSTLDVVRDVVDGRKEVSSAASPAEGQEAGEDAGGTSSKKEPDDENYTDVPFNKHPRFKQLIQERNTLRGDAQSFRNVQGFLDSNGLSSEEAADGLTIMAQAKTDPAGAWKRIQPWVQKVLIAAGEVLPDDLNSRVQRGELTHDVALQLSRNNAQLQSVHAQQEFQRQQAERQTQHSAVTALYNTAADWEKDRRLKDPNFEAKFEPIQKEIAFLQLKEGRPTAPAGVTDQLQRAYAAVNKQFRPAAPSPQARKPALRPITGGQVAGNVAPKVESTLDIVRAVVAKRGAA